MDFAINVEAEIIYGDDFSWPGVMQEVIENFGDTFKISVGMCMWRRSR